MSIALSTYLRPLLPWLEDDSVEDICCQQPGVIFIQRRGEFERVELAALTYDHLLEIGRLAATATAQMLSEHEPILSAWLPGGERIQVVIPPVVAANTVALSIRRRRKKDWTLDLLAAEGSFEGTEIRPRPERKTVVVPSPAITEAVANNDAQGLLAALVVARRTIVISGETGSGKTAVLNAMLKCIPTSERTITIEDVREIRNPHDNTLNLVASYGGQGVSPKKPWQLLEGALRLNPTRIILGELRGGEAYTFLEALNTGHAGSMSTIHANSAREQRARFAKAALKIVHDLPMQITRAEIEQDVEEFVDAFVHVSLKGRRRYVSEISYC